MADLADASQALIRALGKAHIKWILANRTADGVTERLAMYVALKALVKGFGVTALLADPSDVQQLDDLADNIEIVTRPVSDYETPQGQA